MKRSGKVTAQILALALAVGGLVLLVGYLNPPVAQPSRPTPSAAGTADPNQSAPSTQPARTDPQTGLAWADLNQLPPPARRTVGLIEQGGPFPYATDGATFGNRERILPVQPNGFYREYTVDTPGSNDRGARRLVTGDAGRMIFYTADHYVTFVRVRR